MSNCVILILIIIPSISFSGHSISFDYLNAENKDSTAQDSRCFFEYSFNLNRGYRILKVDDPNSAYGISKKNELDSIEIPDFNAGVEFSIGHPLKKDIHLRYGIQASIFSYSSIHLNSILVSTGGTGSVYLSGKYKFQYRHLAIPVEFGYIHDCPILPVKLSLFAGGTFGALQRVFYHNGHEEIVGSVYPRTIMPYFNVRVTCGIEFKINPNITFFNRYSYSNALHSAFGTYGLNKYLYVHAILFGLRINSK